MYVKAKDEVWKVPDAHEDGDETIVNGERFTWWKGQWRRDSEMSGFPSFSRKEKQDAKNSNHS